MAVSKADMYGSALFAKEDCTNHVVTGLTIALHKLETPLPHGEKLKDHTIHKLQTYYQIEVKNNSGSVHGM